MKNKRKRAQCIAVSGFFLCLAAFFTGMTVKSQSEENIKIERKYYAQMESDYRREVKQVLERHGIYQSGINMTSVSDVDEVREYTVVICNKDIGFLSKKQKAGLRTELSQISFPVKECRFLLEF